MQKNGRRGEYHTGVGWKLYGPPYYHFSIEISTSSREESPPLPSPVRPAGKCGSQFKRVTFFGLDQLFKKGWVRMFIGPPPRSLVELLLLLTFWQYSSQNCFHSGSYCMAASIYVCSRCWGSPCQLPKLDRSSFHDGGNVFLALFCQTLDVKILEFLNPYLWFWVLVSLDRLIKLPLADPPGMSERMGSLHSETQAEKNLVLIREIFDQTISSSPPWRFYC